MTTTHNELPSNLEPTGDICVSLFVPNDTEWLWLLVKLLSHGAAKRYWKGENSQTVLMASNWEERVVTPLIEKILASELCPEGGEMSCLDVVNCIETDEAVKDAITESITLDGFSPNPETDMNLTPPPSLSPTATATNLLPASVDCEEQPQIVMGMARAIVSEIHQSVEDFLELIEYATNAAEGLAMASEQIPYFGTAISGALEFMDWVLETWGETYLAAYNQSVEDELSCAIFCHMMDGCTLTIDDLLVIYEEKGSITVPPPQELEAILTFAIDTPFYPDTVCVAMFHYTVLRFMAWGSLGGFSAAYLQSIMTYNVSAADYTYEDLCEDCVDEEPTDYWMLHYDFRTGGQKGTTLAIINGSNHDGRWTGNGYTANLTGDVGWASTLNVNWGVTDLGAAYVIRGMASRTVRRGSTGDNGHDFQNGYVFEGANYTGGGGNYFPQGGIVLDGNKCEYGQVAPEAYTAFRSFQFRNRLNRYTNATIQIELRSYEGVVWGLAGAGDTKPSGAKWVGDTLPATFAGLFPDYVAP